MQQSEKAMQRSRLAAVDNIRISLQESFNGGFIHLAQIEFPIAEPFAESGDCIHLHWHRRGQETLLFNMF
jgi:hypothetical protein